MTGFSILKSRVSAPPILRIEVDEEKYVKVSAQRNKYYLLTSSLVDAISTQLGSDRRIAAIAPDTIFFRISNLTQKRVPIQSQLAIQPIKEYMLKGTLVLSPDSTTIYGERSVLDSIHYVQTVAKVVSDVSQSIEGDVALQPLKNVKLLDPQVKYSAAVVRFTEGVMKATVHVQHQPADVNIILLPGEVELKYRAAIEDFAKIEASQFTLAVDYEDILSSSDRNLKVYVVGKPNNVLQVTLYPPFVEFIIQKN